ncbi:MAG: ZIP family metal transporter [Planctomycetes bacterium]|nr:ZIP family metal transporter [Planctomycetota bacterium]MCB9911330.1 ZIP family metal transporter [Planctomycetota bacterium]MCB9912971.1 ZIP family metal transporter [Planctomycetota bacterium]HPF15230.1 ZIP family metal transporter [Planctomycetota bacterium]HRV81692.1 ZIP family metal transporter [Planctomycetota bacterium]
MWDLWAIFAIAVVGGAIPLMVRWSDRGLHVALALSTGLFLGAVFLHLLPSLSGTLSAHASEGGEHGEGELFPWLCVLLGALGVYLFEALFLRTHDHDDLHRHQAVGVAAMVGLSVHALTAGVSYGLARQGSDAGHSLLVAVLAHKGFETFSLVNVFQLAGMKSRSIRLWMFAFACVTPLGAWFGHWAAQGAGQGTFAVLQAIAAGTFLFVCLGELLPEVFHHREDSFAKIGLMAIGVGLMWYLHGAGI